MNDIEKKYVPVLASLIEEARNAATNKEMLKSMAIAARHLDDLEDKLLAISNADIELYDEQDRSSELLEDLCTCGYSLRLRLNGISTKLKKFESIYRDSDLHPNSRVGKHLAEAMRELGQ